MPGSKLTRRLGRAAEHTPGLRQLPVARLLLLGEVAILARNHIERLEPSERRRLVTLLREAHGRPSNLNGRDRRELQELVAKAEPKLFAQEAAEKLSPVRLPKRLRATR
ncbi:MAG TPA: hypothetical protein VG405_05995 [Solirubrobacteraceae bacterium]|jgi:hypothetical protein|nr:hypothetical protein [Solirubrobacteraceae bacterium]